jgi:hypothetical protein
MDLPGSGPGPDGDGLAVDVEPEDMVVSGDGDDLAGVDHADLDSLSRYHDLASLGYAPLHRHRSGLIHPDAWQTGRAVARKTALAMTQYREWSSIPVTIFTSRPSTRNALAVTFSCHSCIATGCSHRL